MDGLRQLLSQSSEPDFNLDEQQITDLNNYRDVLDHYSGRIEEMGRVAGLNQLIHIGATARAAALGLSDILASIKADQLRKAKRVTLEGSKGGN